MLNCKICGKEKKRERGETCTDCSRINYRAKNREKLNAKYREFYAKNQATVGDKRRKYRAENVDLVRKQARERMREYIKLPKNKLRAEAVTLVNLMIKRGRLFPKPCVCGCPEAQAHHDSYLIENWLRVRWLCIDCHKTWHMMNEPEYPNLGN